MKPILLALAVALACAIFSNGRRRTPNLPRRRLMPNREPAVCLN